jgi:BclB C-terminal domain-containing protein
MGMRIPGPRGPRGFQGPVGPTGPTGPTGATGATGALTPGTGAIIPFASGTPVTLTTVLGGLLDTGALVGFGSSFPSVTIGGGSLTLGGVGGVLDFAFVVPRAGTVTSISAFFSATVGITLTAARTVRAELWSAPANSNTFTPTGAFTLLAPSFGPVVNIGDTASNTSAVTLPVSTGDKLLMVFSVDTVGLDLASTLIGFASAGVEID